MTNESFKQIRSTTFNRMTKEEIQNIHPFRVKLSIVKSNIGDVDDSVFYNFTSEQLAYLSSEVLSYIPNHVLKNLLELHKDEKQNISIYEIHYSRIKKEYYINPMEVSGNAIRIQNGLNFQKEKEEIQMEIEALREIDINERQIGDYIPFRLVMARLQDAYSPVYDKVYKSFTTKIINGEQYVSKKAVLQFLNSHKEYGPEITEIPCLSSFFSLVSYPVEEKRSKLSHLVRKYDKQMTILNFSKKRFFITEDLEMLLAISRNYN